MQENKIDYEQEWETEVLKLATKSAGTSWVMSAIIIPFFAFFEYNYSHERFLNYLYIFLGVSAFMLGIVLWKKYFSLPAFIATYGISIIAATCFGYMAAYTQVENVHNYLLAVSTITLVRGLLYFGKTINLILVSFINHTVAFFLILSARCEPFWEIPSMGSTLFFGGIFMLFAFAGMNTRYKITKENFINTLKLKISRDIIEEKNKEITDSITYAKRIQNSLLTSEKYIARNLNKLLKKN
ncbi:MAG TPA: hypothetical protein VNZ49_10330 [Bacteroidia bacterium]|jgi:sigma-B regulation protein RsbU (phosphoserine phosphatase)|nr:hypothetical protein [Bacteroidia bacterium]